MNATHFSSFFSFYLETTDLNFFIPSLLIPPTCICIFQELQGRLPAAARGTGVDHGIAPGHSSGHHGDVDDSFPPKARGAIRRRAILSASKR